MINNSCSTYVKNKMRKTNKYNPRWKKQDRWWCEENADRRGKRETYLIIVPDHCRLPLSSALALSITLPLLFPYLCFLSDFGISGHSFPEGYRLSFPTRTNYMYAVLKQPIPKLRTLTICLWLRPAEGGIGTPLSYAVPEQPNELVLLQGLHSPTELLINDKVQHRL